MSRRTFVACDCNEKNPYWVYADKIESEDNDSPQAFCFGCYESWVSIRSRRQGPGKGRAKRRAAPYTEPDRPGPAEQSIGEKIEKLLAEGYSFMEAAQKLDQTMAEPAHPEGQTAELTDDERRKLLGEKKHLWTRAIYTADKIDRITTKLQEQQANLEDLAQGILQIDQKLEDGQCQRFLRKHGQHVSQERPKLEDEFNEEKIQRLPMAHQDEARAVYRALKKQEDALTANWKAAQEAMKAHDQELGRRTAWLHDCLRKSKADHGGGANEDEHDGPECSTHGNATAPDPPESERVNQADGETAQLTAEPRKRASALLQAELIKQSKIWHTAKQRHRQQDKPD